MYDCKKSILPALFFCEKYIVIWNSHESEKYALLLPSFLPPRFDFSLTNMLETMKMKGIKGKNLYGLELLVASQRTGATHLAEASSYRNGSLLQTACTVDPALEVLSQVDMQL